MENISVMIEACILEGGKEKFLAKKILATNYEKGLTIGRLVNNEKERIMSTLITDGYTAIQQKDGSFRIYNRQGHLCDISVVWCNPMELFN